MTHASRSSLLPLRDLQGRRVVVVGVGKVGRSAARFAKHHGANVVLLDDREATVALAGADDLQGMDVVNDWDAFAFDKEDIVALSPGVPRRRHGVQRAIAAGATLVHELELAAAQLDLDAVIGITGTNGKSTTTALLGRILEEHVDEADLFVGGNLGPTLGDAWLAGHRPRVLALELSSYQLETMRHLRFDVVGLTNLAPDHLDRYDAVADYYAAKLNLQALCDGPAFANAKDATSVEVISKGWQWFDGADAPRGDVGADGMHLTFATADIVVDNPALVGAHNCSNAVLAGALALAAGASIDDVKAGIEGFAGIPHRLEHVGEVDGVRYFNDSKATNVDAAKTALMSFSAGVHLIVGGVGKGASYDGLVAAGRGRLASVHCIGDEQQALYDTFANVQPRVFIDDTLDEAVAHATRLATAGDVVLLAPACASFDQFQNFEVRGDAFRQLVLSLQTTASAGAAADGGEGV